MKYVLENESEPERLSKQCEAKNFSVQNDLKNIYLDQFKNILDAGCGSGDLAQYVSSNCLSTVEGCDQSKYQIEFCNKNNPNGLKFFQIDFVREKFEKNYDLIINRHVAHHLSTENYIKALNNFYQSLNHNGMIAVIDPDGVLINIGTHNKRLQELLNILQKNFHGNLNQGRKIPQLLTLAGFVDIQYSIEVMDFQEESRKEEVEQWSERLAFAKESLSQSFSSMSEYEEFVSLYLKEISQEETPLFYNKFIITGFKKKIKVIE